MRELYVDSVCKSYGTKQILTDIFISCKPGENDIVKNNQYVKPFLDKKSKELSGGERRIIEILLIIHSRAEYILIDEPFNGVEPLRKEDVKTINSKSHSSKRLHCYRS